MFCWFCWKGDSSFILLFICSNNYDKSSTPRTGLPEQKRGSGPRWGAELPSGSGSMHSGEVSVWHALAVLSGPRSLRKLCGLWELLGKGVMLAAWGWRVLGFCQPGDIIYWGMLLWFFLCCGESLQGISPDTGRLSRLCWDLHSRALCLCS